MAQLARQALDGLMFPESPRWHAGHGAFFFSDIDRGEVHQWRPGEASRCLYRHTGMVSGLAFESAQQLLVCAAHDCTLLRLTLGPEPTAEVAVDLAPVRGWGINDMVRAADGTCYVNSVDFDFLRAQRGEVERCRCRLLVARPDGSVDVASDEMFFPNGMAITPDGRTLVVADSRDHCVGTFAIGEGGRLGPRRVVAHFPGELPDGLCLDAEGAVWVANHGRVVRLRLDGTVLDEVTTGEALATACALGGEDGRTLLITTSDAIDRAVMRQRPSGRLFTARVEVPGAGLPSVY
jgi:sugar lactone lactonase YvrE